MMGKKCFYNCCLLGNVCRERRMFVDQYITAVYVDVRETFGCNNARTSLKDARFVKPNQVICSSFAKRSRAEDDDLFGQWNDHSDEDDVSLTYSSTPVPSPDLVEFISSPASREDSPPLNLVLPMTYQADIRDTESLCTVSSCPSLIAGSLSSEQTEDILVDWDELSPTSAEANEVEHEVANGGQQEPSTSELSGCTSHRSKQQEAFATSSDEISQQLAQQIFRDEPVESLAEEDTDIISKPPLQDASE